MGRNTELSLVDEDGRERANFRLVYGSRIWSKKVTWFALATSLLSGIRTPFRSSTEKPGKCNFMDLVEGLSMKEVTDETLVSQAAL